MTEGEVLTLVRRELQKHLTMFFTGETAQNTNIAESVDNLYGQQPLNVNIPAIRPYGFASRAPVGTKAVVAKTAYDPRSKILVGHRDTAAPTMKQGETVVYNASGKQLRLETDAIRLGLQAANNPMVLGNEMMNCIKDFVAAFTEVANVVETAVGPGFLSPDVRTKLQLVVSKYITTASTNIVSQIAYTERGGNSGS